MFYKSLHRSKGFTLIELLLVISIIGLLSAIVLASLQEARKSARDSVRFSDIRQINNAIQLYVLDHGHAPYLGECDESNDDVNVCQAIGYYDTNNELWNTLEDELSDYLPNLPTDPCGQNCPGASDEKWFVYKYLAPGFRSYVEGSSGPTDYQIFAESLETKDDKYGFKTFDYGW